MGNSGSGGLQGVRALPEDRPADSEKVLYIPVFHHSEHTAFSLEDKRVCLIGSARVECQLLAKFIEQESGVCCTLLEDMTQFAALQDKASVLFMWDCYRKSAETILSELQLLHHDRLPWMLFCLFNLEANSGVELAAVEFGACGFFYEEDAPENLIKGIRTIFQGEIWLDRKTMSEYIMHKANRRKSGNGAWRESLLTPREAEILRLVAAGYSNADIAKTLLISYHTVKAHIYKIYKKIEVSDRLQAAKWKVRNLYPDFL